MIAMDPIEGIKSCTKMDDGKGLVCKDIGELKQYVSKPCEKL